LPKDDPVAPLLVSRFGGNAATGAKLLSDRPELSCLQCHMIHGRGSNIGPDLSGIGSRADRTYLLESLVTPAARIARGFALIAVTKTDGGQVAGTIQKESATELVLKDATGKILTIPPAQIKSRSEPVSGMPAGLLSQLTPFQLRDLIEYLASLKAK
jgi:quinoprotein glucose dehydrogenase